MEVIIFLILAAIIVLPELSHLLSSELLTIIFVIFVVLVLWNAFGFIGKVFILFVLYLFMRNK
ncbi:hypothetical protein ACV3K4_08815 [Clostridium perfringens]|uniref:hypothetical protein n=1 Tax=Clostridium perfringens TaxID=1502 RepID=UPI000E4A8AE3|nr:hypothetical protein [Clostridium perfringens]RHN26802.1 hypothetical protein DWZ20_07730 [Clostridium perfringens]